MNSKYRYNKYEVNHSAGMLPQAKLPQKKLNGRMQYAKQQSSRNIKYYSQYDLLKLGLQP